MTARDVLFELRDLPEPSSFGAHTVYIAWATTPQLNPVVKLGVVRNGQVRLGRVAFDRILLLISAEASADVSERSGPLVLRGTSASVRMQPHDAAFLLAGFLGAKDAPAAEPSHDADHAAHTADTAGAWTPPLAMDTRREPKRNESGSWLRLTTTPRTETG